MNASELGGGFRPVGVHFSADDLLESALQRFKLNIQQEDIINEIKRHSMNLRKAVEQALAPLDKKLRQGSE
jgi:ribosomal protein S21